MSSIFSISKILVVFYRTLFVDAAPLGRNEGWRSLRKKRRRLGWRKGRTS